MHGYKVHGGGELLAWAAVDYENFLAEQPDITTRKEWRQQLLAVTRHLLENRWPLRIHATYDESTNHILDVFEKAHALEVADGRLGFAGIRWAFNHGETLKKLTLQRIKAMGGTRLHGKDQRLTREEALFHHTVGSARLSQEELLKGRIKPGQFADFAMLNAPYFEVGDEDVRHIESELTITGGKPVYGAGEFRDLVAPLEPIQPVWSPVASFGGFYSG